MTHENEESARETFRQREHDHEPSRQHTTGHSLSAHNYHSDDCGSSHLSRSFFSKNNTTGKIGSLQGFGKPNHHNTTDQIRRNAESIRHLKARLNQQRMKDFAGRLVVDEQLKIIQSNLSAALGRSEV